MDEGLARITGYGDRDFLSLFGRAATTLGRPVASPEPRVEEYGARLSVVVLSIKT